MGKIRKNHLLLLIIIAVHILLLLQILFFPYPELMVYSYLTDKGLIPYSNIFDQHFPGIMFFPVNLASLGLNTRNKLRLIHILLILINHMFIYLISYKLLNNKKQALISNLLYLLYQPYYEGYVLWIESFVVPLILAAYYFLIGSKEDDKKSFISGLFLGASLLFKQVIAPLIGILILYLLWKKKEWKYYLLGIGAMSSLLIIFTVYYSNLDDFIYWTFTFNVTTFAQIGRKLPGINDLILSLPILASAVIGGVYLLVNSKLDSNIKISEYKIELMLVFVIGTCMFFYARFDFIHLQPLIPFSVIILSLIINTKRKAIQLITLSGVLLSSLFLLPDFYQTNVGREDPFLGELESKLVEKVNINSENDEPIFAMATTPHIYYLTDRLPPGKVFVFQFPWFMKEVEDKILNGIISDPPAIVLRDPEATVQGMNLVTYMPEINTYINNNYEKVDNIDGIEIMKRK